MTEEERDAQFTAGDEEALAALIACYAQALTRYCHHILCDYHEAQDAVQTVFVKAYRARSSFRPGTAMGSWLYRLAYTTCVDLIRKRRRQLFAPPPAPRADPNYIGEPLRSALAALPPLDRALVYGRVVEERGYGELSEQLGRSPAALRKRYERARKKLAHMLTSREEAQHEPNA